MGDGLLMSAGVSLPPQSKEPSRSRLVLLGAFCEPHASQSTQRTWGRHPRRDTELEKALETQASEEREKELETVSKSTKLITQKDQLFPIFSEDRTKGNRLKGLRFKLKYLEGFPSSV